MMVNLASTHFSMASRGVSWMFVCLKLLTEPFLVFFKLISAGFGKRTFADLHRHCGGTNYDSTHFSHFRTLGLSCPTLRSVEQDAWSTK